MSTKPCLDVMTVIKNDLCAKLSSSALAFNQITPQQIADCSALKKFALAKHLLKLISVCSDIPRSSIELSCTQTAGSDITQFETVTVVCGCFSFLLRGSSPIGRLRATNIRRAQPAITCFFYVHAQSRVP